MSSSPKIPIPIIQLFRYALDDLMGTVANVAVIGAFFMIIISGHKRII